MRKTYLRLGALLLMCASGMNSFAEKGDPRSFKFTGDEVASDFIVVEEYSKNAKGEETIGKLELVKYNGGNTVTIGTNLGGGKDYEFESTEGFVAKYIVTAIKGETRTKKSATNDELEVKPENAGAFPKLGTGVARTVTLGKNIQKVGEFAFSPLGNAGEYTVVFNGAQLTSIGTEAFKGATVKTSAADKPLDLSKATEIGVGAFAGAKLNNTDSNATEVILTDINAIPANLFKGVTTLETVEVSEDLTKVGDSAFEGCAGLENFGNKLAGGGTQYVLPITLTEVGAGAFKGNTENVHCGFVYDRISGIEKVGAGAFEGCAWLDNAKFVNLFKATGTKNNGKVTDVNVNAGCEYGKEAFKGTSLSGSWNFAEGTTSKAGFAWTGIQKATLTGYTEIADGAFEGCMALEEVALPTGLTKIGVNAFKNAVALGTKKDAKRNIIPFDIPNTVTKIGEKAFTRDGESSAQTAWNSYYSTCYDNIGGNEYFAVGQESTLFYLAKTTLVANATALLGEDSPLVEDLTSKANAEVTVANAEALLKVLFGMKPTQKAEIIQAKIEGTALGKALKAAASERVIRILPDKQSNQVVELFKYEKDNKGNDKVADGGKAIADYTLTKLYVPMGLQSGYASTTAEEKYNWAVPATEANSHLYTYEATTSGDIYLGSLKYTIQEGWKNKYTGGDMTPEVKLTGICQWNEYTKKGDPKAKPNPEYFTKEEEKGKKYTQYFKEEALTIPATVVKAGEENKKEYVYYTVVGVEKLNNLPKLNEGDVSGSIWYDLSNLESVTLPATLESIGDNAFAGTGLTKIDIPASVKTIGANAFEGKLNKEKTDFVGVREITLNWKEAPSANNIAANAFGDKVYVEDEKAELKKTYLPRYVFLTASSVTLDKWNAPFNDGDKFQIGEGITIQKVDEKAHFVNVNVKADAGVVTRTIEIVDNNDILKLEVLKSIKADVTYTRTFKPNAYQAWFVPFKMKADQNLGATFYKIYDTKVVEGTDGNPVTSLELVKVKDGETIKANVPYLVVSKEKEVTFQGDSLFQNNDKLDPVTVRDVTAEYTISGTVEVKNAGEKKDEKGNPTGEPKYEFYAISGGVFMKAKANAELKACRIYMTKEGKTSPYVKLHIMGDEEDETAILNMETGEVLSEPMYDLSGRRISSPVKGQIYIQGNVKKLAR